MKLTLPHHRFTRIFAATSAAACTLPSVFAQSSATVEWDTRWGTDVLTSAPSDVTISDENSTGNNKPQYDPSTNYGSLSFADSPFVTAAEGEKPSSISAQFAHGGATANTNIVAFADGRTSHNGETWYNIELGSVTGRVFGGGLYTDSTIDSTVNLQGDTHIHVRGSYTDAHGVTHVPDYITLSEDYEMIGTQSLPCSVVGGSHLVAGDSPHSVFNTTSNTYITLETIEGSTQVVGANLIEYSYGEHAVARRAAKVNFTGNTHIRIDSTVKIPAGVWDSENTGDLEVAGRYGSPPIVVGSHFINEESDSSEGDQRLSVNHTGDTHIDINLPQAPEGTYSPLTQSVVGSMYVAASSTDTVHKGDTHVNIDLGGAGFFAGSSYGGTLEQQHITPTFSYGAQMLVGGGVYTGSREARSISSSTSSGIVYNKHLIDGNTNLHLKNVGTIWSGEGESALFVGGSMINSGEARFDNNGEGEYKEDQTVANQCTITGKSTLTIDGMQTASKLTADAMAGVMVVGGHVVNGYDTGGKFEEPTQIHLRNNSILGGTLLDINDANYFGVSTSDLGAYIESSKEYLQNHWWRRYDNSKTVRENLIAFVKYTSGETPPADVTDEELVHGFMSDQYDFNIGYNTNVITGGSLIQSESGMSENSVIGDITVKLGDDNLANGKSMFYKVHGGSLVYVTDDTNPDNPYYLSQGNVNVHIESGADVTYLYSAGMGQNAKIITESTTVHAEEAYTGDKAFGMWSGDYELSEDDVSSSVVTGDRTLKFSFEKGTDTRGTSEQFDFVNFDVVDVEHAAASVDFSAQDLDQLNGRNVLEEGATQVTDLENSYGADTNTLRKTGQGSLILGATNGQQKGGTLQLVVEQGRVVLARDSADTTKTNFKTLVIQQGATLDMRAGHYDSVTGKYSSGHAGVNGDLRLEVGAILQADASRDSMGSGVALEGGSMNILGEGKVTLEFDNLDKVMVNQTAEAGHILYEEGQSYFEIVLFSELDYHSAISTNLQFEITEGTFDQQAAMATLASKYFDSNLGLKDVYLVFNANGDIVLTGSKLVIPEPSTATLSLLALAGLMARRRRRHV